MNLKEIFFSFPQIRYTTDLLSVNVIDWERLRRDVERYERQYYTIELQCKQQPWLRKRFTEMIDQIIS